MTIQKIFITTTNKAPIYIDFNDVPNRQVVYVPVTNLEMTRYNTVQTILSSNVFINAVRNDWILAYDEDNQPITSYISNQYVDVDLTSLSDGETPVYNSSTGKFETTHVTSTGSDNFLKYILTNSTDETIIHTFGREANVQVFDNDVLIDCEISYPVGFSTTKVRIRATNPINGYAILT